MPPLLAEAGKRALKPEELKVLAEALRRHEPWLEWAGKRESDSEAGGRGALVVDPVALHIHERVSAQAILRVAARQDVKRDLFADPEQDYKDAVQFYQHDVDWANRLILGDSLQVMSSLARREGLAGKVQMIYIDPPYGIKFGSNFQPEVGRRDVGERDEDLTREPEVVRAYRDTWNLGIHSYLTYLRDRLITARELLAETGCVFLQISDANVHRVRVLLDDVFGPSNQVATIAYKKAAPQTSTIRNGFNYVLWYARNLGSLTPNIRKIFRNRRIGDGTTDDPKKLALWLAMPDGHERPLTTDEKREAVPLPEGAAVFRADKVRDSLTSEDKNFRFDFEGEQLLPGPGFQWRGTPREMARLRESGRLVRTDETLAYKMFMSDSGGVELSSLWEDTAGKIPDMRYSVQTNEKIVARCILMATAPGDLVLDPTCGSGTTAFVAEQWGRRWIAIDTSRVAISIARQRLLTATYDFYAYRDKALGITGGLKYRTVSHITLKAIAQDENLDPIFERHRPVLDSRLEAVNRALASLPEASRGRLTAKLLEKQKVDGKRGISVSDRRRWELPRIGGWEHWQVPFDIDPDWSEELRTAVAAYRAAWRARMLDVNSCIDGNAPREDLVNQPEVDPSILRVSGPFSVESIQPPEVSLGEARGVEGEGPRAQTAGVIAESVAPPQSAANLRAYLVQMYALLKQDGVTFLDNKSKIFSRLDPLFESGRTDCLHAEGRWIGRGDVDPDLDGPTTVGVVFGPQYGPISAQMVEDVIRPAARRYDDLIFAGFAFDGEAVEAIRSASHPKLRIHMAHIRPDINPGMAGLLRDRRGDQLFTVFGHPRAVARRSRNDWIVRMEGVDIYDPVTNRTIPTRPDKVAAWFLDGDYDGRTFCITQAFFPDSTAWGKLAQALKGVLDVDRLAAMSGTPGTSNESLPFPAGRFRRAAVKVIDPRGNEVMTTLSLEG